MTAAFFSPFRLKNLELTNRFVRSATWEGMCDEKGAPGQKLEDYYRQLVRGGVGLIISGYTFVRADGKQLPGKMGIDHDTLLPALRSLTDAVHDEGGLLLCQLVHAGGQTSSKTIGTMPLAPSAIDFPSYGETPREMTQADIRSLVTAFADGAARAQKAGFDGIQLHGAHGYLIHQFLSPLTNQRQDDYGGDLENRSRFLFEVYAAVREAVGVDFPVTIKLTAADNLPEGFTVEDAVKVAQKLDSLGIDAIEVSSGSAASGAESPVRQGIDTPADEAYNAPFARRIKEAVAAPVMVVGGLRSLSVMKRLLENSDADLFSLSRPLIREPALIRHWQQNEDHRATCISCNGCFRPGLKEGGIDCVVERIEEKNRTPVI